ncbi:MAG: glycosyltransferase family 39 protein [Candidatus Woesebacteria bacterium]|jgi:Gpi18-like mannosyltransferase
MIKKCEIKKIAVFFFIWRIFLFLLSFLAPHFLEFKASFPFRDTFLSSTSFPECFYSWGNFDGVHYLLIAKEGYHGWGLVQAFFPLFPLLIKIFTFLFCSRVFTALLISNLSFFLFLLAFYTLVKKNFDKKLAWLSIFIVLAFPTSFFFAAIYNESLFLLLVILSFLAAEKKNWILAGSISALASATRIVGVFLVPALLLELWMTETKGKSKNLKNRIYFFLKNHWQKILAVCLGSFGLLFYMIYLKVRFHDALYFLHVQSEFGASRSETIILYPQVLIRYLKILITARPFDWKYFSYIQEFIISTLGLLLITLAYKIRKMRLSYLVFTILAFFTPTLTGTFSSMPRYILVCFPIFIYLANILKKHKITTILYLTISLFLLIINTVLFIRGYWVA